MYKLSTNMNCFFKKFASLNLKIYFGAKFVILYYNCYYLHKVYDLRLDGKNEITFLPRTEN